MIGLPDYHTGLGVIAFIVFTAILLGYYLGLKHGNNIKTSQQNGYGTPRNKGHGDLK